MGVEVSLRNRSAIWLIIGFLLLGGGLFTVNYYSSSLQIGMRSFSFGSSQYIKSHDQASTALYRFIQTEESSYYDRFLLHMNVVENLSKGRQLLVEGGSDEDELIRYLHMGEQEPYGALELIRVYQRFSDKQEIKRLINLWGEADRQFGKLKTIAGQTLELSEAGMLDTPVKEELSEEIYDISEKVNEIDSQFFAALRSAGMWVDQIVNRINLIGIAIFVLLLGTYTSVHLRAIRKWNEKMEESEKKFKVVLNNSQDVIYQMDLDSGKYVYMSPSAENMLGYDLEEMKEGGAEFVLSKTHPEDLKRMQEQVQRYKETGRGNQLESDSQFRVLTKSGEYIWVNNKRTLLYGDDGEPAYIIGNVRDISERKKYTEALDRSLKEKEVLLSEIHHRVKNNLSIVSSLIELQKNSHEKIGEQDLKEIQDRIKSIALVHEKLYQAETLADVDLAEYIDGLVDMITSSLGSEHKKIRINKELDSIQINNKKAVPVGLIVNELINNCYKYAFKNRNQGNIDVILRREDDAIVLTVQDDGNGLPDDFEKKSLDSLGMTLINAFTKQVDGEMEVNSENGTSFTIRF